MKKYFSFLLVFSLIFVLGISLFFGSIKTTEAAVTHSCTKFTLFDSFSGYSCAVFPTCIPDEAIDWKTGKPCPGFSVASTTVTTSINNNASINPNDLSLVRRGDKNKFVVALQEALKNFNFDLVADGIFGPQTERIVKSAQAGFKITADGVVGPNTWREIVSRLSNSVKLALLQRVDKSPASSGSGDGSSGEEESIARGPVTTCVASSSVSSRDYEARFTADNHFKGYIYNKNNKTLKATGIQDLGGYGSSDLSNSEEEGVYVPETKKIKLESGDQLVFVQMLDENLTRNALLGQLTFVEGSSKSISYTTAGNYKVGLVNAPNSLRDLTDGLIKSHLESNLKLETPYAGMGDNSARPWIVGIDADARWIAGYPNGKVPKGNKKMAIFVTSGDGVNAAPKCETFAERLECPYPQEGTGKLLPNGEFDCKWPVNAPADVEPGNCGWPELVGAEPFCEGVYPRVRFGVTLKFSAKAYPVKGEQGVEIAMSKTPVTLKRVGTTHKNITYELDYTNGGIPPPLADIESSNLFLRIVERHFGWGGFFKNGITNAQFDITPQVSATLAGINPKIDCTDPSTTTTLDISVTKACGDGVMDVSVEFSAIVNVTGSPVLQVLKSDGTIGNSLLYISGSGSKVLKFRHSSTATSVDEDAIGKFVFKLPLDGTIKIASGSDVYLEDEWTAPDSLWCPAVGPTMCLSFDLGLGVNYKITFPYPVIVEGDNSDIKIKIVKTNGTTVFANYTGGNADSTVLNFMLAPGTPLTSSAGDFVGAVTLLLSNGAKISSNQSGTPVDTNIGTLTSSNLCSPVPYLGLVMVDSVLVKEAPAVSSTGGFNNGPQRKLQIKLKFKNSGTGSPNAHVLGFPAIYLQRNETGDLGARAVYVEGSGTDTLTFEHTSSATGYEEAKYDLGVYNHLKLDTTLGTIHTLASDGITFFFFNSSWFSTN